ncbi:MAG: hypothetical protein L0K86_12660 [Actinomycetia bacterium]|nr:hypothetical protein [Actinomycetes bacterium]
MYNVALLIEHQLTAVDTEQVVALHEALDQQVRYHLLMPVEDAAGQLTTSLGALGGPELVPVISPDSSEVEMIQENIDHSAQEELDASIASLQQRHQQTTAQLTRDDPVSALATLIKKIDGQEAIILTEPHVISEFFHLDWTSRARRKLDIPTLHLLEHETFEEQGSGAGEGVDGM